MATMLSLPHRALAPLFLALLLAAGCSDSSGGKSAPPPPPTTSTNLAKGETPPGVVFTIEEVSGADGPGGTFAPGNRVSVRYRVTKTNGEPWGLAELEGGVALISGPSFNYQRVVGEQTDLLTASKANSDGSFTYRFASPLPKTYLAPYNDTPAFGPGDGELTGQPLLGGTYTVGLSANWRFTVEYEGPYRDPGATTADFLLGGTTGVETREMVLPENCNRCHDSLRSHGGTTTNVKLCGLCHTSGAEDRTTVAGGTPGASIDLRVMIHKIHNGKHLPSVLGVSTRTDGSRDYDVPPQPYVLVGAGDVVHDYSQVGFPIWPNLTIGLPRDSGYSDLDPSAQAKEDQMLRGAADCAVCHGDPDGAGPMTPPTQGLLAQTQPTRRGCGSCHDDWVWDRTYTANGLAMPPQLNDSDCKQCHLTSGNSLAVVDGHQHPLSNLAVNPGLRFEIESVTDVGAAPSNGRLETGEKLAVSFTVTDEMGAPVDASTLDSVSATLSGPTSNLQMLLNTSVPTAALSGAQPYAIEVPERVYSEYLGTSTVDPQDSFPTDRSPHWNVAGALTEVYVQTATPFSANLAANAVAGQNYVDVDDASGFARNEFVALRTCPAGEPELLRIQWVDGNRLWFSSPATAGYQPGLRLARSAGDCVLEVRLALLTEGVHYDLDEVGGIVTEISNAFGDGNFVVTTYTSDFVAPAVHGLGLNDSPDLDETSGKWNGKSLVSGTYSLTLWGYREVSTSVMVGSKTETTTYRGTAPAAAADFAVGTADPGALEPYALIEDPQACNACHQDLWFHGGGRRGWASCLACHGTAGSEDRPRYVAPGAPDTTGVLVSFRELLHKLHMGADLANAATYTVVGYGPSSQYPDNFSEHTYEGVEFPPQPGGTSRCVSCHGDGNQAWKLPSDRNHPTEPGLPVLAWRQVCGACHDSAAASTHFASYTLPGGLETCAACHGLASSLSVLRVHAAY